MKKASPKSRLAEYEQALQAFEILDRFSRKHDVDISSRMETILEEWIRTVKAEAYDAEHPALHDTAVPVTA